MKRVVITGLGITSCIGNDKASVTESLKTGRSGITFQEDYASLGMRSQVAGVPKVDFKALIDRKALRFMGDAAAYAHIGNSAAPCLESSAKFGTQTLAVAPSALPSMMSRMVSIGCSSAPWNAYASP